MASERLKAGHQTSVPLACAHYTAIWAIKGPAFSRPELIQVPIIRNICTFLLSANMHSLGRILSSICQFFHAYDPINSHTAKTPLLSQSPRGSMSTSSPQGAKDPTVNISPSKLSEHRVYVVGF